MLSAKETSLSELLDAVPVGAVIGVNFLTPSREDFPAVREAAARMPYVECFWAEPDPELVRIIHAGGALAGWQVGSAREAREAKNAGCDLIVAQGVEAGGHVRGTLGLLPLLDEVRAVTDLPIVGAGGIGTGRAMAGALAAGAEAVRVGTRFMAATESTAHPAYIDGLLRSGAEDTILTTAFGDGWPDAQGDRCCRRCTGRHCDRGGVAIGRKRSAAVLLRLVGGRGGRRRRRHARPRFH